MHPGPETEATGPWRELREAPATLVQLLPLSSPAFQFASGLGAFRYPELIKVFDRFQLEYEFLPETSTIRFPKHDAER